MSKVIIWLFILVLTFFLILMLIDSRTGVGDAATRGIGKSINIILILAIICLVVLNLLPYDWSKYLGLLIGLIAVTIVVVFLLTLSGMLYQDTSKNNPQYEEPSFDDPILTELYMAFKNGDIEKWKKLLQKHTEHIHNTRLQNHALLESNHIDANKLACLQYMIDSGAEIVTEFSDFIFPFATNSQIEMVKLFLENGADPNAIEQNLNHWPVIYEAISGGYGSKVEIIDLLIKHGADANAKIYSNEYQDTITPLMFAVQRGYWHSCIALLENCADPNYQNKEGKSIKAMVLEKAILEKDEDQYPKFWEFVELLKK